MYSAGAIASEIAAWSGAARGVGELLARIAEATCDVEEDVALDRGGHARRGGAEAGEGVARELEDRRAGRRRDARGSRLGIDERHLSDDR